jgi:hypothetical protein
MSVLPLLSWMLCVVNATYLAVPAYFYPVYPDPVWARMTNKSTSIIIANPASGPGTTVDPNYRQQLTLNAMFSTIIGYVHTSFGARPLNSVIADMNTWISLYPNTLGGFFVDEGASSCTFSAYYNSIFTAAKQIDSRFIVMLNPGTIVPACYSGASDILVNFESSYTAYQSFAPSGWESNFPPSRFCHIVYATPNAQLTSTLARVKANNASYTFLTDLPLAPNPYAALPSYWDALVAAIRQSNQNHQTTYNVLLLCFMLLLCCAT